MPSSRSSSPRDQRVNARKAEIGLLIEQAWKIVSSVTGSAVAVFFTPKLVVQATPPFSITAIPRPGILDADHSVRI